jgi:hypothetical protein
MVRVVVEVFLLQVQVHKDKMALLMRQQYSPTVAVELLTQVKHTV